MVSRFAGPGAGAVAQGSSAPSRRALWRALAESPQTLALRRSEASQSLRSSEYSCPSIASMPAAVVNHLHFRQAPDTDLFARAERQLVPEARITEGIRGLHIAQVSPDHFVLVILGDDADLLDEFAANVGSTWMKEVEPLLASPPERHLGPLVTTTD